MQMVEAKQAHAVLSQKLQDSEGRGDAQAAELEQKHRLEVQAGEPRLQQAMQKA